MDDYFVHESSYIDEGVSIGRGTKIWHFCHIQKGKLKIALGTKCHYCHNVKGNGVKSKQCFSI